MGAGRLHVSQLAIEANVKHWHLTHQHPDLRRFFQTKTAELATRRTSNAQVHSAGQGGSHSTCITRVFQPSKTLVNLVEPKTAKLHGHALKLYPHQFNSGCTERATVRAHSSRDNRDGDQWRTTNSPLT
ncbi:hypothetical protein GCM10018793_47780 [Streptomyces sulfonofaciens]|uniref:Uncharacterized protein n=1 Tax=Streptomyces sulfonofaciens TaxID=68272 RepID=A0A919GGR6_9ACTN|nr:hypothetical protein GCM10018793_47780 [Streptomyces sulfonofaciens]